VDKPFESAECVKQIMLACNQSGVAFMDGTHFVHSKRFELVTNAVQELDSVMPPKRVLASFSMPMEESLSVPGAIRADSTLEPSGPLGDLGWYNCRVFVALLGPDACEHVTSVSCFAQEHPDFPGLITRMEGLLILENGSSLIMNIDASGPIRQCFSAETRTGAVYVHDFVLPETRNAVFSNLMPDGCTRGENGFDVETSGIIGIDGKVRMQWPVRKHVDVAEDGIQAKAMLRTFSTLARNDDDALHRRKLWARETLVTQFLLDKFVAEARDSIALADL
jgi:predicted dehydrogenase